MLWGLGAAVYSMDHEVVPRSCRICEWILSSSRDHFGLQQGTYFIIFFCQSDRGVQALQKTYFELWYVVHWNGPIGFALGEAKEVLWWTNYMGSWQKNVVMINFEEFWMGKRRWRQEKARAWSHLDFIYLFLSKLHFWGICLQLQHIQCLVHDVVPLDPHLVYT